MLLFSPFKIGLSIYILHGTKRITFKKNKDNNSTNGAQQRNTNSCLNKTDRKAAEKKSQMYTFELSKEYYLITLMYFKEMKIPII